LQKYFCMFTVILDEINASRTGSNDTQIKCNKRHVIMLTFITIIRLSLS